MGQNQLQVHIKKEALKFSSAHMTVFPDGTKEPLHGHNYTTAVVFSLKKATFQEMISFSDFKKAIAELCQAWDEKILIPQNCPYLSIQKLSTAEMDFLMCGKRYVLPRDEVVCLEVENITVEILAEEFCRLLCLKFETFLKEKRLLGIQVTIEESPGQGATFLFKNKEKNKEKHQDKVR